MHDIMIPRTANTIVLFSVTSLVIRIIGIYSSTIMYYKRHSITYYNNYVHVCMYKLSLLGASIISFVHTCVCG